MNRKYSVKPALMILITSILLITCKPNTEFTAAPTKVILTVIGLDGTNPQKNAKVVLFEDEATFLAQSYIFGTTGSVAIDSTDENGEVEFDNLSSEKNYYVMAYTIDSLSFKQYGYVIHNDNSNTGFEFFQKLNKSATTRANVYLQPSEAIVSFYANSNFNASGLPIAVLIDRDTLGYINSTVSGSNVPINNASNPVQNGVITKKVRIGARPLAISFINQFDCLNIGGSQSITPGDFTAINANVCDNGKVEFTADDVFEIDILLNGADPIGALNVSGKTKLSRSLEPGTYTYLATSTSGKCTWQGSVTIKSNSISQIKLPRCI